MEDIFSLSPLTNKSFREETAKLIARHGEGGIFLFSQFGHGGEGPSLLLGDISMEGIALEKYFRAEFAHFASRPYAAMIMGGCYSGGFAQFFLNPEVEGEKIFTPDFFFGGSPPLSVNYVNENYSSLGAFYGATLENADYNRSIPFLVEIV